MTPVQFVFGLHLHQPVGNFDSVFQDHLRDVYQPLLDRMASGGCLPLTMHLSGPLLDWLDRHAPDYLDRIGRLAADGQVELLGSGFDEPILAVLPREDRLEQVGRMNERLHSRFGQTPRGLWLTERVWEPDLAGDLARAGIEYALVDDRHFLVAGFEREALHRPFRTEADGHRLGLFPIDERLRYLIPFRPPEELAGYLGELHAAGQPLAILADDGEKFGGWPGTLEWVYQSGWLEQFLDTLARLRHEGIATLSTCAQAWDQTASGGLAYLPSASYREMEGWALPAPQAVRLAELEADLTHRAALPSTGALIRGSHWRHFLVKYPEANRMHKKMLHVSRLCRDRGDPPEARQAVGRAQCNDAYWHGVFGGLYLPHLRHAVWSNLAHAERVLRAGEPLGWQWHDIDADGVAELLIHSALGAVQVAPARGGAVEEWTSFATGRNLVDVLTRRREAYHHPRQHAHESGANGGMPSIHDLEQSLASGALPPVDPLTRALFQERMVPGDTSVQGFEDGTVVPIRDWADLGFAAEVEAGPSRALIRMRADGLDKQLAVEATGGLTVEYRWDPARFPVDAWFTVELTTSRPVHPDTPGSLAWRYPVETVSKSERGFDRTVQGHALVLVWPAAAGSARVGLEVPLD